MEKYGVVSDEIEPKEEDLKEVLERQKRHNRAKSTDSGVKRPKGPGKHRVRSKR